MGLSIDQPAVWCAPIDWAEGVTERLEHYTVRNQSADGTAQKRSPRLFPRREFEFALLGTERARRLADALLVDRSSSQWRLPIWPDQQFLRAVLPAASDVIPCRTAGFDWVVGGEGVLLGAPGRYEVVTLSAINADSIQLAAPTAQAWPPGTKLCPLRRAYLADWGSASVITSTVARHRLSFLIDEPCAWPAALPVTEYRGLPVLELRPDWSDDLTRQHTRQVESFDSNTGSIYRFDMPGIDFPVSSHPLKVVNRADKAALRSLLYGLRGMQKNLWRSTSIDDLRLIASTAAGDNTLPVDWCGYTVLGRGQTNRRDIRIELFNGTALHRRIINWSDAGESETLTLDAVHGIDLSPANVHRISFLELVEQASDTVEIQYPVDADGMARTKLEFRAVQHVA